jgi:DNA sulfur modification protein DndD
VVDERSAGAEQIVALSLIDGLNKTSGTKAPIIMDTPLGRLDPKHRNNILQYLPGMSEQVVLLVHEGEIHAKRDTEVFASRIGARYEIKRISAKQSRIERV